MGLTDPEAVFKALIFVENNGAHKPDRGETLWCLKGGENLKRNGKFCLLECQRAK